MKFNFKYVILIIAVVGLIFGLIYRNSFFNDIENNKAETIGKVYRIRHVAGSATGKKIYEYEFNFRGQKYTGEKRKRLSESVKIGEYYKVKFSDKNPENSIMEFDTKYSQIINTVENGKSVDTIYKLK